MNRITKDDVEFFITITPEEDGPEGWMEDDMAVKVREDYDSGNEWAWCQVSVCAHLNGFEGFAFLGGCSYRSEEEFRSSDYFTDMCDEAYEDLLNQIDRTKTVIRKVDFVI